MDYDIVDAEEAPPAPKKTQVSKEVKKLRELIQTLEPGKVARITLSGDQTQRGLKISVGRIGTGLKKPVKSWTVDGDPRVFVQLKSTEDQEGPEE